jgi:hypothetical protein
MNQKTIEVSRLTFIQVDIFGCYLPTRTSIESVLAKLSDKRNKRKICGRSNELVVLHSQYFDIPDSYFDDYGCEVTFRGEKTNEDSVYNLKKISIMITADQCKLAGLNARGMAQTIFVKSWFEGMVGGFDYDVQKMRKMVGNMLECTHNNSKFIEKYADVKLEPLTSREKEYPEYVAARVLFESFYTQICLRARYDKRMWFLLYQDHQIIYEILQRSEDIKDKTCINVCLNCRIPFESKQMPSVKICNSCKNRSAEQKKVSRRLDRGGWVRVGTGKCDGGCGSPKIKINTSGSCLECYRSNN